jgi:septum formation protein
MKRQIILASTSPRRLELFKLLNIEFKVVDSGYEEIVKNNLSHTELVKFLALGKAEAAAKKYPRALIVAADTMVSFRGEIIGKPKDKAEAIAMLKSFSGKVQILVTGVVVMDAASGKKVITVVTSKIYFKKLSERDILDYVRRANPYDKAGGYNLQGLGLNLIKKVEGDFTNNLGLPMGVVFNALQKLGVKIA